MKTYIIAEAGVNHNGNRELALKMIDAAKDSGCDCIKFQTFRTESLVTTNAKKAKYQVVNTGNEENQYDMLKKLELTYDDFKVLKQYCGKIGIDFMSTPFDKESVELLEKLEITQYKMSSGDITNKDLLEYVADKKKPIILSTGMSTMDEVEEAVKWIEERGNRGLTLLHCTSNYPTSCDEVNMKAMVTLRERFSYKVGYSDHTEGIHIPVLAVAMGAEVIEKHFTLDKQMQGPDHKASLDVSELSEMVKEIRDIEVAIGDGIKRPADSEMSTREAARKSVVVNKALKKGTELTMEDLDIKRPGTGIAPKYIGALQGKILLRDVQSDTLIQWGDVR